ncbi:hypothetical protein NK8_82890 (plasmid) [Caballeronia sp. NK8]|nr:hypothetical protein NK8_82890 [Caballeronia sp. NK8]
MKEEKAVSESRGVREGAGVHERLSRKQYDKELARLHLELVEL